MNLSEHFELDEFLRSEVAARQGFDMTPPSKVVANLALLCHDVLEPLRAMVGPIVVTSGYRPANLNAAIGGAPDSDHIKGLAADIRAVNMPLSQLAQVVRIAKLPGMQKAIFEFSQWIHVATHEPGQLYSPTYLVATLGADRRVVYSAWEA